MLGGCLSAGFLSLANFPECCLGELVLLWRPFPEIHRLFDASVRAQVWLVLLVFKRARIPPDVRRLLLLATFGRLEWRHNPAKLAENE